MKIELSHIKKGLVLEIEGDTDTLFEISDEEVMQFGEAKFQLLAASLCGGWLWPSL
jgi:hypothetical protein